MSTNGTFLREAFVIKIAENTFITLHSEKFISLNLSNKVFTLKDFFFLKDKLTRHDFRGCISLFELIVAIHNLGNLKFILELIYYF